MMLSVCIPTFNRAKLLRESIISVLDQLTGDLRAKIELVVSDNDSKDETMEVVKAISRERQISIRYFRNERNVGFDANCLLAVERAAGQYVWLLSDDDLLAEGALASLCKAVENSSDIDIFLGEKEDFYLTPDRPMRRRRIMKFKESKVFDFRRQADLDQYFKVNKKLIAYLNFISVIVFKREKWLGIKRKEDYVGSDYIQVYVLQSLLWGGQRGRLQYLPFSLVKRRWGTDPAYEVETKMRKDFQMFHQIAQDVFPERKYRWLIDDLLLRNDGFSWAVRVKMKYPLRFLTVHLPFLFLRYWDHPLFWLKIVPLALVPGFVLRFMRNTYRFLVKGEPVDIREYIKDKR